MYVRDPKGMSRSANYNKYIWMTLSTTKAAVGGSIGGASPCLTLSVNNWMTYSPRRLTPISLTKSRLEGS